MSGGHVPTRRLQGGVAVGAAGSSCCSPPARPPPRRLHQWHHTQPSCCRGRARLPSGLGCARRPVCCGVARLRRTRIRARELVNAERIEARSTRTFQPPPTACPMPPPSPPRSWPRAQPAPGLAPGLTPGLAPSPPRSWPRSWLHQRAAGDRKQRARNGGRTHAARQRQMKCADQERGYTFNERRRRRFQQTRASCASLQATFCTPCAAQPAMMDSGA